MRVILLLQLGINGLLLAEPNTPKQPWSKYRIHDTSRPVPKAVEAEAVQVKAPSDAIVLFDGTNTDAFTVAWPVRDGAMVANEKNTHTKQSFGSCQLHLEWRVPKDRKVTSQQGGNSGVYLMDRYEIQILESHNNRTYPDGQAGAVYGQTPPLVNATAPQGEWQSYDIIFQVPQYEAGKAIEPAKITVIHNGVVIQNAQEIYGQTTFRKVAKYPKEHPEKAPIRLQWHGDPIEYRNIWVRPL